jgi:hypothetical protein
MQGLLINSSPIDGTCWESRTTLLVEASAKVVEESL